MKIRSLISYTVLGICVGYSLEAKCADKFKDLESCYQAYGQLESVEKDGKKVTTYKEQAQVAAECNEKVSAMAKMQKNMADVLELAGVIGRQSNWQSAMPVYTSAARLDSSKAFCVEKDPLYALDLALSTPPDHPHNKGAVEFMDACWPKLKDTLGKMIEKDASGYTKESLCKYLDSKKALTAGAKAKCSES